MSEPEFDRDDPDAESMFDFLAEEGEEKHRRKKRAAEASERPLPIIRKPVPVSESGPLLPPKPGAPVEPPPALTGGAKDVEDDLDFLDDMPASKPRQDSVEQSAPDSNITRLDPRSRRLRGGRNRVPGPDSGTSRPDAGRVRKPPISRNDELDDLELDLDDAPEFNRNRKVSRAVPADIYHDDEPAPRRGRWLALTLALVLIAAGAASFLFAFPDDWRVLLNKFGVTSETVAADPLDSDPVDELPVGTIATTTSPLMQRFQEQLSLIEGLVSDGALDDAEQALSRMDRTVYGYGAAEFGDLESRIAQLRSGVAVADPGVEQSERDEAERVAAEQKAQAEREQLAAAEQAAKEAEAAAAAQAQREERERLAAQAVREEEARIAAAAQEESARQAAAEQSAREEEARVAAEAAAQEERARAAAQQAAQQEQARLNAEKARQEEQARQAALEARTSDWPSVDADRQATDRRIAEERAAVQRQQAREQRLIEAREREAALAAQAASQRPPAAAETTDATTAVPSANAADNAGSAIAETRSIGDDELQTVYRRFIELQQAVSSRDITAVVGLTQRSGARVQQLMQIFENSTQIDARIRNVSTSNATGQIKGTLQINRIKRADGTFVEPPAALSSIPLSSQREGDGWSAISW